MELRINQQYAKIGMNITKPFMGLKTTPPILDMHTKQPELQITPSRLELQIDQRECFADVNRRSILDFAIYCKEIAQQDTAAGIDRIVAEGNQMAAFEQGNTVEQIAANALNTQVDFNIDFIPKHRPRIDWNFQPTEIKLNPGNVELNLNRGHVENQFQRGQVEVYLKQKNHLEINWLGNNIDKTG